MVSPWNRGTSLVEVLIVLLLLLWVLHQGLGVLSRYRSAGIASANRAEELEAVRTVAWILPEEVSLGRSDLNPTASYGDSLTLRAFRGLGLVDPASMVGSTLTVCYRGLRAPAPEKDSILILQRNGVWRAHDLTSRTSLGSSCLADEGSLENWTVVPPPAPGVLARVFERGTYHFADGALRYRRGDGGRQPLTTERIQEGRFPDPEEGEFPFVWELMIRDVPGGVRDEKIRLWRGGRW